jgi:acetoin utilization deacetylase AcuC-like enzyme
MKVSYVYDPIYLTHDTGHHVENARRLEAIVTHLEATGLMTKLSLIPPRAATIEEIALVHHEHHIAHIQAVAKQGGGWLDMDTVMSSGSYKAALYAAGGLIRATEAVCDDGGSAFALVRPPGHHATATQAMGFCLFNNIAIAAKYARLKFKLKRMAIIDFDVHHGNGTQDSFYDDPGVLYVSTHESPLYPGTGSATETGTGAGKDTTVNIPLPMGCGDDEYLTVFDQIIVPAVRRYRPQLILVSAGYDGHRSDELALMQLSTTGFARMVEIIKGMAEELCQGKLVLTLEGGYDLTALAASVKATFEVLLGNPIIEDIPGHLHTGSKLGAVNPPDISALVQKIRAIHQLQQA